MQSNEKGLSVIRVNVVDGAIKEESINHVPPSGMCISDINIQHLEKELRLGISDILSDLKQDNVKDLLFFFEYSKDAVK